MQGADCGDLEGSSEAKTKFWGSSHVVGYMRTAKVFEDQCIGARSVPLFAPARKV